MLKHNAVEEKNIRKKSIDHSNVIQHLNEGIVVLQGDRVIYANNSFCRIMECDMYETLDKKFTDFFPTAERKAIQSEYKTVLKTQKKSNSHEFLISSSSKTIHVELTMSFLELKEAPLVLATVTDITAKYERIDKIRKLNDRLESILHSMHDVVISFSAKDGSIISINPAAELLFGIPIRQLSNINEDRLFDHVHPDDRENVQKYYYSLRELEFNELEYRIIRSDGKIRWVLDEGYIVYCKSSKLQRIDHMIRDITEQKMAIRNLHKSERKYKDFFHKTKDMAFRVSPDGVFLDINDAGIDLLGLPNRKTSLQSNVYNFVEHTTTISEIMSELNSKGHISNKYVTLKSTLGKRIEVDITARAQKNELGETIHYEGIASNITQALENQRNRVLRNTAAGMCHYLNSHLMQISSAQSGIEEEILELDEKILNAGNIEEINKIWITNRDTLNGYTQDINSAYKKINEITRAFNSAFLKYREESYLDKTILDIFNTYRKNDID